MPQPIYPQALFVRRPIVPVPAGYSVQAVAPPSKQLSHVGDGWIDSAVPVMKSTLDLLADDDDSDIFADIDNAVTQRVFALPNAVWGSDGLPPKPAVAFPSSAAFQGASVTSPGAFERLLPEPPRTRTSSSISATSTSSRSSSVASAFSFASSTTSSSTSSYAHQFDTSSAWAKSACTSPSQEQPRFIPPGANQFSYAAAAAATNNRKAASVTSKLKSTAPVFVSTRGPRVDDKLVSAKPNPRYIPNTLPTSPTSPSPLSTASSSTDFFHTPRSRRSGPLSPTTAAAAAIAEAREIHRLDREQHGRVHVDASKVDVVPYDGGKTTVLTGGVMLGTAAGKSRSRSGTVSSDGWRL